MQTLEFDGDGRSCGGCSGSVQRVLALADGASHIEVTLKHGTASVSVSVDAARSVNRSASGTARVNHNLARAAHQIQTLLPRWGSCDPGTAMATNLG